MGLRELPAETRSWLGSYWVLEKIARLFPKDVQEAKNIRLGDKIGRPKRMTICRMLLSRSDTSSTEREHKRRRLSVDRLSQR